MLYQNLLILILVIIATNNLCLCCGLVASVPRANDCCAKYVFKLEDHIHSSSGSRDYCIRLDNIINNYYSKSNTITSFSCNRGDTYLSIYDDMAKISGLVYKNQISYASRYRYLYLQIYKLDFTYNNIDLIFENDTFSGFTVDNKNGMGKLVIIPTNNKRHLFVDINSPNITFEFKNDNYLLTRGSNNWVGRGELSLRQNMDSFGSQHWLFTAKKLFVTRSLCFWKNNDCLKDNFVSVEIDRVLYYYDDIKYILLKGNPTSKEKLLQQIIVTKLNFQFFGIDDEPNGSSLKYLLQFAIIYHKLDYKLIFDHYTELLQEVNESGNNICLPNKFHNICKECSQGTNYDCY